MKKVIYNKENGEVFEGTREKLTSNAPFLTKGEKVQFVDKKVLPKMDKNIVLMARRMVCGIISDCENYDLNIIKELYDEVMNVVSEEDMTEVTKNIYKFYNKYIVSSANKASFALRYSKEYGYSMSKYETCMKDYPQLMNSIAVKSIIFSYYLNYLREMGPKEVNKLEKFKNSGESMKTIFNLLGIRFKPEAYKNGIFELASRILNDSIDNVYDSFQVHLCWENCTKANTIDCPKVANIFKKNIAEYDFITDGYQIYDEKNKVDVFVVTKCKNYVQGRNK